MPRPIRKPPQWCTNSFPATLASCADRTQSTEERGSCITTASVPSYNPAGAPPSTRNRRHRTCVISVAWNPLHALGMHAFSSWPPHHLPAKFPVLETSSLVSPRPHPRFPVRGSPPPGSWLLCETLLSPRCHHPQFMPSTLSS